MCGICGKLWFDPARPADVSGVRALADAIAHRGPDGEGFGTDGPVAKLVQPELVEAMVPGVGLEPTRWLPTKGF